MQRSQTELAISAFDEPWVEDPPVLFRLEAACVVGPHGAALTNFLWAPPGAAILEVFQASAVRRCYWSMCKTLGHRYT